MQDSYVLMLEFSLLRKKFKSLWFLEGDCRFLMLILRFSMCLAVAVP